MKVIKRNGEKVSFDGTKISKAILKAMDETEKGVDLMLALEISKEIEDKYSNEGSENPYPNVEDIQDDVEEILTYKDRFDVAKKYIIYREKRNEKRDKPWEMTELQRDIYEKKYRFEDESFGEFLDRTSGGDSEIRKLMQEKKFLPAGRILANRGLNERGKKVCYSNCFVNKPPEDNLESIFDVAGEMARTYSFGGGVGLSLEHLRPKGAVVNNSADETTGSVSFMDLYSLTTGLIGMRGRRGALMLTLPIDHPDIEEFIDVKNDLDKVNFANISIMITDDFMVAVENDDIWELKFEVESTGEVIRKEISARKLFRKIAENNHKMAEPGMLFWNRVEDYHINSEVEDFKYSAVNPCGEVPLNEGGSCLLSSINLSEYVIQPFSKDCRIDFDSLRNDIPSIVRFMDDLLEEGIEYLPLDHQKESAINYRQIGIGVMGLADMLIKMRATYGSGSANRIVLELMSFISNEVLRNNALLAKIRGTYPKYTQDVLESEFVNNVADDETFDLIARYGLRNGQLLSIAPNGSISTLLGVSGGIEPVFALSHNRKSESLGDGEAISYKVYAKIVQEYMEYAGLDTEKDLPKYFITSHDIDYKDRVGFQGIVQMFVDNAISSTVNLPNSATIEDVEDLYMLAWKEGLKGVTVYRDGCMREGILSVEKSTEKEIDDLECNT